MLDDAPQKFHPAVAALAIVLLTAIVYIPAMRADFVWDDDYHLHDNVVLTENGLYKAWFTTEPFVYYPMTWTSFWIEYQLWGLHPTGYHVVNVALHIISALLVWRILLRLRLRPEAAWLAAMIFAVHPVNVESVAWITQRKNTMAMIWFLVSLWSYLHFDDTGSRRAYAVSIIAFVLAMLGKGAVVTLPAALLVLMWWRHGRLRSTDVVRSLPLFAVSAGFSFVEVWFQNTNVIKQGIVYDASFLQRTVTAALSCWFYLYKALLPWRVCFVYPRWQLDAGLLLSWIPLMGMIIAAAICWRNRTSWGRPVLAGTAFFVLLIAPALGFAHFYYLRYSLIADHYQYFAILGLIALAAGGWSQLKQGRIVVATVVVAALSVVSWQQCTAYANATTLWHDTLKKNPDAWLAHNNLGNILSLKGQWDKALIHHRHVVRLQPNDPLGHNNLGQALAETGQIPAAIRSYQRALRLKPDYATAMNNLGATYGLLYQNDQAEIWFRRAIQADPKSADAYDNLGVAMRLKENYADAERYHRKAIEYDPGKVMARHNLALVLKQLNRVEEAEQQWREALRVEPDAVLMQISLSRLLSARPDDSGQRAAEAVLWASRAVTLTHGRNPRIVSILGEAYAATGDWAQAIEATEHALKILPPKDTRFAKILRERLTMYRSRASK